MENSSGTGNFAHLNANFKSTFMKKILVMLAAAAVLAVASLSVSSCTKANPLVGTTWTGIDIDGDFTTLTFPSESMCMISWGGDGCHGTYTYSKPTVTMIIDGDWFISGTVSKKTITLNDFDGYTAVLTKQ